MIMCKGKMILMITNMSVIYSIYLLMNPSISSLSTKTQYNQSQYRLCHNRLGHRCIYFRIILLVMNVLLMTMSLYLCLLLIPLILLLLTWNGGYQQMQMVYMANASVGNQGIILNNTTTSLAVCTGVVVLLYMVCVRCCKGCFFGYY